MVYVARPPDALLIIAYLYLEVQKTLIGVILLRLEIAICRDTLTDWCKQILQRLKP